MGLINRDKQVARKETNLNFLKSDQKAAGVLATFLEHSSNTIQNRNQKELLHDRNDSKTRIPQMDRLLDAKGFSRVSG